MTRDLLRLSDVPLYPSDLREGIDLAIVRLRQELGSRLPGVPDPFWAGYYGRLLARYGAALLKFNPDGSYRL